MCTLCCQTQIPLLHWHTAHLDLVLASENEPTATFFSPKYNLAPTKEALVFPWKKIPRAVIYNLKGFFCCCHCFVCLVFINGYHLLKLKNIFCSPPKKFTNLCWVPNLTLCNPIKLKCKSTTTKAHFEPQRPIFSSCTSSSRELHYLTNK